MGKLRDCCFLKFPSFANCQERQLIEFGSEKKHHCFANDQKKCFFSSLHYLFPFASSGTLFIPYKRASVSFRAMARGVGTSEETALSPKLSLHRSQGPGFHLSSQSCLPSIFTPHPLLLFSIPFPDPLSHTAQTLPDPSPFLFSLSPSCALKNYRSTLSKLQSLVS